MINFLAMNARFFHSDDQKNIRDYYFSDKVKAPKKGYHLTDLPLEEISFHGVKLGFIRKWRLDKQKQRSIEWAAWQWFSPPGKEDNWVRKLLNIKKSCNLEYMSLQEFRDEIKQQKENWLLTHPELFYWLIRRTAQIDWLIEGQDCNFLDKFSKFTLDSTIALQRAHNNLHQKILRNGENIERIIEQCEFVAKRALALASASFTDLFGENAKISANLMLPFPIHNGNEPAYLPPQSQLSEAVQTATSLWNRFHQEKKHALVIVADTKRTMDHLGFWVPIVKGKGTNPSGYLPGAVEAFEQKIANAVYKYDPPSLISRGFDADQEADWYNYLRTGFKETLFVSIPLVLKIGDNPPSSIAVMNVNATPNEKHECNWARAYHGEWLNLAQKSLSPLIYAAVLAVELRQSFEKKRMDALHGTKSHHLDIKRQLT